jgi:hypothetical protein
MGESSPAPYQPVQVPPDSPQFSLEWELTALASNLIDNKVAYRIQTNAGDAETAASILGAIQQIEGSIKSLRTQLYAAMPLNPTDPRC